MEAIREPETYALHFCFTFSVFYFCAFRFAVSIHCILHSLHLYIALSASHILYPLYLYTVFMYSTLYILNICTFYTLYYTFCFLYSAFSVSVLCILTVAFSLQLWVYAYFLTLAPEPVEEIPPIAPYSHRYDGRWLRRTRETFLFFRQYFDIVTMEEVTQNLQLFLFYQ